MSKDKRGDPIAMKVAHERAWAYARWLERLTWQQMRQAANLPESEGGLGYDLSLGALQSLTKQARADAGDLTMGRDERIERQAVEVDARARAARHDFVRAYENGANLKAPKRKDFPDPLDWIAALSKYAAAVAATTKAVESADRRLEVAQQREAKLFGLDAPIKAELEVTNNDAVMAELNAMLVLSGAKPITATPER